MPNRTLRTAAIAVLITLSAAACSTTTTVGAAEVAPRPELTSANNEIAQEESAFGIEDQAADLSADGVEAAEPSPPPTTGEDATAMSAEDAREAGLHEWAFEFAAAAFASRAPEPVDAVDLVDPVRVEGESFSGFSFGANDRTELLIVPGPEPSDPAAFAMVLDPESVISFQSAGTAAVLLEEPDLITLVAFNLTFELGPRDGPIEGTAHTATFSTIESELAGYETIVTFVANESSIAETALRDQVVESARARWATMPEAPEVERSGDGSISASYIPLGVGVINFGMTVDEFAVETGDDLSSARARDDRTTITVEYAEGDIETATFFFRTPDDLLYEVVLEYRISTDAVHELALEMFGPEDPNMPDIRARATDILLFGDTDQDWLLPTPDGFEAWAKRTDTRIVIVSTMPDTEMGFVPASAVADDDQPTEQLTQVLVVTSAVPSGTTVAELLETPTVYLSARAVPSGLVADSAIRGIADLAELQGLIANREILPGEQLLRAAFDPAGSLEND